MSFAVATILVVLAVAVAAPAVVLAVAVVLAGRPPWLSARDRQPDIHTYLLLVVLAIAAVALAMVVPFAVAFSDLPHRFTGVLGVFLAVLILLGLGYAWRRGVLRWG